MDDLQEMRIRQLEQQVHELQQRLLSFRLGPYAKKSELYRVAGRRFVDNLIDEGKLIPESVPGFKRPQFCTQTFAYYADRYNRLKVNKIV